MGFAEYEVFVGGKGSL